MVDQLSLPADPESPRAARRFVAGFLSSRGYESIVADAELLTSEVVSNAVIHGGRPLVLDVEDLGNGVRVRVSDPSPALPRPRRAAPWAPGGRGLSIVATLASDWGISPLEDSGKDVWFELRITG